MAARKKPSHKKGSEGSERTSPEVSIREMVLEDIPKVYQLGEKTFTAEKWPNLYRTWDEYEVVELFASNGDFCLVAELGDRIVGFALGTYIDKRRSAWSYGYLLWLGVAPKVRRKGVARRLLNRLTALFIEEGARIMILDTEVQNRAAMEFFESQGFGNKVEHVYLSQNLASHPEYIRRRRERKKGEARNGGGRKRDKRKSVASVRAPRPGADATEMEAGRE